MHPIFYKKNGSGGSAHGKIDERGSAQEKKGSAQDGIRSSQEVGDGVGRVKVDGV